MKKGFTLIELVMVIVILGIISMFGADLYQQIYKSYLHTRALNQLESRTQNAITLISNRLENRIYGRTIFREHDVVTGGDMTDFINISAAQARHDVLEWVGQSVETKDIASNKPGWSGFIDTGSVPDSATAPVGTNFNLTTQGSQLGIILDGFHSHRNQFLLCLCIFHIDCRSLVHQRQGVLGLVVFCHIG